MRFNKDNFPLVAKTFHGLEEILAAELKNIGVEDVEILRRAVKYKADQEILYKSNLMLRTAVRILKPVHMFRLKNEKDLYLRTKEIDWDKIIRPEDTFAISSTVNSKNFNHANFVSLKTKDAIVDKIRNKFGKRPDVDKVDPDINLHVHISNEDCEIYLDSSGESLHKRGLRHSQTYAPLNEILAAGMIIHSGWKGDTDFLDPMCGSGTISLEAAMIATNTPPGFKRDFAFQNWQDYNPDLWKEIYDNAMKNVKDPDCNIYARDVSLKSIRITEENIASARFQKIIQVKRANFFKYSDVDFSGMIIMNPPYGERLELEDNIEFYRNIGDSLKQNYKDSTAWVLSSDKESIKNVGLKPSKKLVLYNGKLECKYHKFDIY